MAVLFNGTNAANGFDSLGHYVRDELLVSDCTGYAINPVPGCSARFTKSSAAADDRVDRRRLAREQSGPEQRRRESGRVGGARDRRRR